MVIEVIHIDKITIIKPQLESIVKQYLIKTSVQYDKPIKIQKKIKNAINFSDFIAFPSFSLRLSF